MGYKADGCLTERIKREIERREPSVTFQELVDTLEFDEKDILLAVEELKVKDELNEDTIFWRGAAHGLSS